MFFSIQHTKLYDTVGNNLNLQAQFPDRREKGHNFNVVFTVNFQNIKKSHFILCFLTCLTMYKNINYKYINHYKTFVKCITLVEIYEFKY